MPAADWVAAHGADLVGLPPEAASAEVRAAALHPRTVEPGAAVTLEFRPDRVSLLVDDGVVREVRAG